MPVLSRLTEPKVAAPPVTVTAPPPVSAEPPGLLKIASDTLVVLSVVTRLSFTSRMFTVSDCDWSAARLSGRPVKTIFVAAPGVMSNVPEVTGVSAGDELAVSV